MLASDFRKLVDQIPAAEKILLIDACESEEIADELLADLPTSPSAGLNEAVIVSTRTDQFANFDRNREIALFTKELTEQINEGATDLHTAFLKAKESAHRKATELCQDSPELQWASLQRCAQTAILKDPHNLIKNIMFQH